MFFSSWSPYFTSRKGQRRLARVRRPLTLTVETLEERALLSGNPPVVLIAGPTNVNEGTAYNLKLHVADPENDPGSGWTINWGDGQIENVVGNPPRVSHTYPSGPINRTITASAVVDGASFSALVAHGGDFLDTIVSSGSGGLNSPRYPVIGPDGNLYVGSANSGSNNVLRYQGPTGVQPGAFIDVFVPPGSGGLDGASGILFLADRSLLVTSTGTSSVLRYDGTTGAFLGAFVSSGSGGLDSPSDMVFGPDNNLYVVSWANNSPGQVLRYDGATGAFLNVFVPAGAGGLGIVRSLAFGPDGNLYVTGDNRVLHFNGATGAYMNDVVPQASGGLYRGLSVRFGPDGDLYVASAANGDSKGHVYRYDGSTGTFLESFASGIELSNPIGPFFAADGNAYVSSVQTNAVLRYTGPWTPTTQSTLPVNVLDVVTSTYTNNVAKNITDLTTITSTINITDPGKILDLNVKVNISHTWDSDLDVFLIAPDGTRIELFTDVGGNGDNFTNSILDDEATQSITAGTAPFSASFRP